MLLDVLKKYDFAMVREERPTRRGEILPEMKGIWLFSFEPNSL